METGVLATLLGIALAALVAACGAGFRWLRSDFRDLRSHVDARFEEQTTNTDAQFTSVGTRLDRLEAKVDDLIMALARAGSLTDPQLATPESSPLPPVSGPVLRPPDPAPPPTETPESRALPAETLPEIAQPPRAPPESADQPWADHPARRPPSEPFGPTAAPA